MFGGKKKKLIRGLVEDRCAFLEIDKNPLMHGLDYTTEIQNMGFLQLMGLPEATVVTCVETFFKLRNKVGDEAAIFQIEAHRSRMGSEMIPAELTLVNYLLYRLEIEHGMNNELFPVAWLHAAIQRIKRELKLR